MIAGILIAAILAKNNIPNIPHSLLYLLASIASLISIRISIKKAGKEIKELNYDGKKYQFIFFNKLKQEFKLDAKELNAEIHDNRILFSKKLGDEFIGVSYIKNLKDSSLRSELEELFAN